jgi:hypothetical protein
MLDLVNLQAKKDGRLENGFHPSDDFPIKSMEVSDWKKISLGERQRLFKKYPAIVLRGCIDYGYSMENEEHVEMLLGDLDSPCVFHGMVLM